MKLEYQEPEIAKPHLKEKIRSTIWRHVFTEGHPVSTKAIAEEIGCKTAAVRRNAIALSNLGFIVVSQGEKSTSPLMMELAAKHRHFQDQIK